MLIKSRAEQTIELIGHAQSDFYKQWGAMTDRFFVFETVEGKTICNPFLDSDMNNPVDPIEYYRYRYLDSIIFRYIKEAVNKYDDLTSQEIADEIIKYVTYND